MTVQEKISKEERIARKKHAHERRELKRMHRLLAFLQHIRCMATEQRPDVRADHIKTASLLLRRLWGIKPGEGFQATPEMLDLFEALVPVAAAELRTFRYRPT